MSDIFVSWSGSERRSTRTRDEIEFCEFFGRNLPALRSIPYRVETVWCPVGHMVVEKYPYHEELPAEVMERSRKVMLDVMWEKKRIDYAGLEGMPEQPRDTASRVNTERQAYPRGSQSFSQLFAAELEGTLDVMFPRIEETLVSLRGFLAFAELLNRSTVEAVIAPTKCQIVSSIGDALAAMARIF